MPITPFKLERYFAKHEFSARYLLSASDCESLGMAELLQMAAPASRALWDSLNLAYTESPGHPLLRAEVAKLYERITPDQVLIAVPEEAIYIAMRSLLSPGDHVVVLSPAYQSLAEIARFMDCSVTPWMLEPTAAGWKLDLGQLEQSLTAQTRLLVLNFPNNPTGYLPARAEFDAIISFARKHQLAIFADEMYRLLESDGALQLPSVADVYECGIALSGLSKSFALPGLRIGWLASQDRQLIERCLEFKDYTTICNSAPAEILGIIALQNTVQIVQRNREIIRANIAIAEQFFNKHRNRVSWVSPKAGSVAFPRWLGTQPVEQFCQSVLEEQATLIVPGNMFDFPGNYFRVGLGRKNFGEVLEHLDEYFASHT